MPSWKQEERIIQDEKIIIICGTIIVMEVQQDKGREGLTFREMTSGQ